MSAVYLNFKPRNRVNVLRIVRAMLDAFAPPRRRVCRHPDSSRQRTARQRARDWRAARQFKRIQVDSFQQRQLWPLPVWPSHWRERDRRELSKVVTL